MKTTNDINVRKFILDNYSEYSGDESFLQPTTDRTQSIWDQILKLINKEKEKGILDLDINIPSSIISHKPGYIDKSKEIIFGLQTDQPLKRAIKPNGGIRLVQEAAKSYGYEIPEDIVNIFTKYRKTHNDGVFDVYSDEIKKLRHHNIITGLPDNYGRGRIIGDYRRVALYGTAKLIEDKKSYIQRLNSQMSEYNIRTREEISEQIKALIDMTKMANDYGYDISIPATNSREAIQWIYFAYLAAAKQQDGAAMSLGRIDAFLDVYIENDLKTIFFPRVKFKNL
jgi:formate C-acetyltransferase